MKDEMTRDPNYWLQRPLTEQMIKYAQQDVSHLFIIYRYVEEGHGCGGIQEMREMEGGKRGREESRDRG